MKKWLTPIIVLLLSITLVACGTEDANVEDIYKNAVEAAEEMKSAEFEMDMKQNMEMSSQGMEMTMDSKMEGSMTMDPLAVHQKGSMNITMAGESMEVDTEMYMVDGEIYVYESQMGQWMQMDESMVPMADQQPNVKEQLEMMKPYIEDFKQEETNGEYVLNFTADGEGVKELTQDLLSEYMNEDVTAQLGDINEILDNTEISDLNVEMTIDKETYQLKTQNISMDMKMTIEGEELNLSQQVNMEYTSINKVDSIQVPQEVKDSTM